MDGKNRFEEAQELKFSSEIAKYRDYARFSILYTGGLALITLGWGIYKARIPKGNLVPLSASVGVSTYLYDRGFSTQTHRVSKEAHKILQNERKKYFKTETFEKF